MILLLRLVGRDSVLLLGNSEMRVTRDILKTTTAAVERNNKRELSQSVGCSTCTADRASFNIRSRS